MSAAAEQHADERRFCTFMIAGERYGVDILAVREVHRKVTLTRAHGAPPVVRGLMNLRGQIITVLDPAVRLGYDPAQRQLESRVVIVKAGGDGRVQTRRVGDDLVGLWVDRICDVISVPHEELSSASAGLSGRDRLVRCVVQVEDEVVRIFAADEMLGHEELS